MSAERLSVKPLARATAGQKELGETGARVGLRTLS